MRKAEPWALAAILVLLYLAFPSHYYNFDGVACAIAVELGDYSRLAHGNHLSYGILGRWFYRLWQLLGYEGRAIVPLQALDSLLGGLGVGLFCRILLDLKISRATAMLAAAGLGISHAYWWWSLEAQVYILGTFFLLLALRQALRSRPRPLWLGLWHAQAALGHVGHAMFLPAMIWRFWNDRAQGRAALWRYAACVAAVLGAVYAAAAIFCVRPADFQQWRVWLLGSAALNEDRSFHWYGGYSLEGLGDWAVMSARVFVDPSGWPEGARLLGWFLAAAAILSAAASAYKHWRGPRSNVSRFCALWLGGYALLFASWQPHQIVYRVSDLPALWILIALGAELRPWLRPALALWIAVTGLSNGMALAGKISPEANRDYQESLWIARLTPENAWVTATGQDQVYLPYFAGRRPLNLRYYAQEPAALLERIEAIELRGEPVFVTRSAAEHALWGPLLASYGLELENRQGEMTLYKVKRNRKSGGINQKKLSRAEALKKGPNGMGSERLSRRLAISDNP